MEFDTAQLQAWADEELDDELKPYVEPCTSMGRGVLPMLRHPLVYQVPLVMPGQANTLLARKKELLAEARAAENWEMVVFLHERAHRLTALLDNCIGYQMDDEDWGRVTPLRGVPEHIPLALDVWRDCENIEQHLDEWRALFDDGTDLMLFDGPGAEAEFMTLPDPIPAFRGGIAGDWSWTPDIEIAMFFARRSGYPVRHDMIPKADVFGYLLGRGENELLVRMTPERERLVHPNLYS